MRRSVIAITLLVLLLAPAANARHRAVQPPSVPLATYMEGGYASAASVAQGASIDFHIATRVSPFNLQIVNLAAPDVVLQTIRLQSAARDCTGMFEHGCDWPVTTVFQIPAEWPSGYYAARFPTSLGTRNVLFLVREDQPGSQSRLAVVVSTHTYQAYNLYGGKSLYPSASPARVYRVSFDRPYHDNDGLARYPVWDKPFVQWMKGENRPFEVLSDGDLEDPTLLGHYDVAVLIGHSEYWTAAARASLEQFLAAGGRLAVLGGDTMWWQVRLEQRQLVCYKSAAADPESGHNDAVVTVNWYNEPVLRPENLVVGVSYRNANLTNRYGPVHSYTVTDAAHWIFDGTGVLNGSRFGLAAAGIEVDGAIHNCTATGFEAEGSDGTPLNFRILATIASDEGRGTIGIYTTAAGGAVFNAATQNWTLGLGTDPVVAAMTRNVFDRFLAGRVPHEPVTSPWRMRDLFNCPLEPVDEKFLPGWRGEYGSLQLSQRCAEEGPLGLELSGAPPRVLMHRSFAPTGNTTNRAVLDFSLNADSSGGPASIQAALVTLQSRKGTVIPRVARVEFQPSTRSVRLVLFNANNAPGVIGAWVPLAAGWNDVHIEWQSPGACTLRINAGPVQTLVNPLSNQKTGDIQITYDQAAMTGFLCLDALRVQ